MTLLGPLPKSTLVLVFDCHVISVCCFSPGRTRPTGPDGIRERTLEEPSACERRTVPTPSGTSGGRILWGHLPLGLLADRARPRTRLQKLSSWLHPCAVALGSPHAKWSSILSGDPIYASEAHDPTTRLHQDRRRCGRDRGDDVGRQQRDRRQRPHPCGGARRERPRTEPHVRPPASQERGGHGARRSGPRDRPQAGG